MHITKPQPVRYRVLNRAYEFWTFDSLEQAFLNTKNALRYRPFRLWQEALGETFDKATPFKAALVEFIIQSERGDAVPVEQLLELNRAINERRSRRNRPKGKFREGSWPGISAGRGHRGSYYRLVQTKNEMAWSSADDDQLDEAGIATAKAGRRRDLPTAWDDIPRNRQRSWKSFRAKQWR